MTKYLDKCNLREKGFILALSSKAIMAGNAWWQDHEAGWSLCTSSQETENRRQGQVIKLKCQPQVRYCPPRCYLLEFFRLPRRCQPVSVGLRVKTQDPTVTLHIQTTTEGLPPNPMLCTRWLLCVKRRALC